MTRMIFVNLAVRDLGAAKGFFGKLGFEFDRRISDETGAGMIINEHAYVMLLTQPFFKTFTKNAICDTSKQTEALLAISCDSRAKVDALVEAALAAGGRRATEPKDQGFMYVATFYDLDGHHWEVVWMDPAALA